MAAVRAAGLAHPRQIGSSKTTFAAPDGFNLLDGALRVGRIENVHSEGQGLELASAAQGAEGEGVRCGRGAHCTAAAIELRSGRDTTIESTSGSVTVEASAAIELSAQRIVVPGLANGGAVCVCSGSGKLYAAGEAETCAAASSRECA